jgi:hypothetical protein
MHSIPLLVPPAGSPRVQSNEEEKIMTDRAANGGNQIISKLPADVLARIEPNLTFIDAQLDMRIYEPYEPIEMIIFPVDAVASVVANTTTGHSTEIGIIGNEGASGLEVVMGTQVLPHRSMIQIAGPVVQVPTAAVIEEFRRGEIFHDLILRFFYKMSVQVSQTTLCNRVHSVDSRLARWLLMCHDRLTGDVLLLTQEFIAMMLGASRVTVTQAARQVQAAGFIKYVRGKITILDREGLEGLSCECYGVVRREYQRQLD